MLDGIKAHLRAGLIEQAIETARERDLLTTNDLARIESQRTRAGR